MMPNMTPTMARGGSGSAAGATCIKCGYDLTGLPQTGACPECGTRVADSLRGLLLRYSSPEYVAKLHRGVFMVVAAIIVQLLTSIGMFFVGMLGGMGVAAPAGVAILLQLVSSGASLVILVGWWLFSEPDPRYTGGNDGSTARKVLRVTLVIYGCSTLLTLTSAFLAPQQAGVGLAAAGLALVAALAGLIAWAVNYFASMRYVGWLAQRIPNDHAQKRAKLLLWLGPLLSTVGILALGLGPLIALVLYWNLLDEIRKDLKAIRKEQGALAG